LHLRRLADSKAGVGESGDEFVGWIDPSLFRLSKRKVAGLARGNFLEQFSIGGFANFGFGC